MAGFQVSVRSLRCSVTSAYSLVVEAGSAEPGVVHREAERVDQVKVCPRVGTHPDDVACVGRYLGTVEHDSGTREGRLAEELLEEPKIVGRDAAQFLVVDLHAADTPEHPASTRACGAMATAASIPRKGWRRESLPSRSRVTR